MTKKFGFELLGEQIVADVEARVAYRLAWTEQSEVHGDTPIERLLVSAIQLRLKYLEDRGLPDLCFVSAEQIDAIISRGKEPRRSIWLQTQAQLPDWRVDFLLSIKGPERWHRLIIECDGHEFHERTKEQATRDRARDRKAQELGFEIFRFTGSELWRDPSKCANQVLNWVENKFYIAEPTTADGQ